MSRAQFWGMNRREFNAHFKVWKQAELRALGLCGDIQATVLNAWAPRKDKRAWTKGDIYSVLAEGSANQPRQVANSHNIRFDDQGRPISMGLQDPRTQMKMIQAQLLAAKGRFPCPECGAMMNKGQVHVCKGAPVHG